MDSDARTTALRMCADHVQPRHSELRQPPVCSRATATTHSLGEVCSAKPAELAAASGAHQPYNIKVNFTAKTSEVNVGGYNVITENYNDTYLPPVIEVEAGDTLSAHLDNLLGPNQFAGDADGMSHGHAGENPTNLHYFHGGIVTPRNDRSLDPDAGKGNGDNIYVYLKNGPGDGVTPSAFDYKVPIPGEGKLDARVLESEGSQSRIAHPPGLNWYHSHMHGISSDQVMGGMSGLISVGDPKANVKAACDRDPASPNICKNDVEKDTTGLKERTDTKYVILRDIPLKLRPDQSGQPVLPENAHATPADWTPRVRDFPTSADDECVVWQKVGDQLLPNKDASLRKAFCQRSKESAWLFTLNGQRFPTITVEGGRNILLRMGNLSANVAFWLELVKEGGAEAEPGTPPADQNGCTDVKPCLTLLSLDGVVPATPVSAEKARIPVAATSVRDLILMPASRAEIYVRNDVKPHDESQVFILHAKKLDTGPDVWPEVQLARLVLKPNAATSRVTVALNAPIAVQTTVPLALPLRAEAPLPKGCVRDLQPERWEHRRVIFQEGDPSGQFTVSTQIMAPSQSGVETGSLPEAQFEPDKSQTIGDEKPAPQDMKGFKVKGVSFEEYMKPDHTVDWEGDTRKHVCIRLDHHGSHKQLWVLYNKTGALHNFHIHQMKFRLLRRSEFGDYHLQPPAASVSSACPDGGCPSYQLFEEDTALSETGQIKWHDTIPVPVGEKVYVVMSFDAEEQIGRFVFHCHILKHEDNGLMAPIEVWSPITYSARQ